MRATLPLERTSELDALSAAVRLLIQTHPDRPQFARTLRQFGERRILELRDDGVGESDLASTKGAFNALIVLADVNAGVIR